MRPAAEIEAAAKISWIGSNFIVHACPSRASVRIWLVSAAKRTDTPNSDDWARVSDLGILGAHILLEVARCL